VLIQVSKDSLSAALQVVLKAVSANSPLPVLSGIKIQAGASGLILTASNLSMTIEYKIPENLEKLIVEKSGEIVVPARYFYEIIRKLDPGVVRLEVVEALMLSIQSEHTQFRLCGMDATEFPRIHYIDHPSIQKISMNNTLFKQIIKRVVFAVATSETRPVLTGVALHINNHFIGVHATDGIRLAQHVEYLDNHMVANLSVVIPGSTLADLSKMLSEGGDDATEIEIGNKQIRFISNGLTVQSALLEGAYPSITNLIPHSYLSEIIVNTGLLLRAAERVSILAGESVTLSVLPSQQLQLLSRSAEVGDVQEEIILEQIEGEPFRVSFNGKYCRDILRAIDSEKLRIKFAGKDKPLVIEPLETTSSTLYLMTPMRIRD
jgi:DNA polymerase-3 subunit beta